MNQFKDYFNQLEDEKKTQYYKDSRMKFYDFFEREYIVDIYALMLKQELIGQAPGERDTRSDLKIIS